MPNDSVIGRRRAPRPIRKCKRTVLWVDDDPSITAACARRLRQKSIRVIPASDGMQGYWLALTRRPDAIVTDLRMPRWKGQDLIECLVNNDVTRVIPTIVLSGYATQSVESDLTRNGVRAVMSKPVDLDRLVSTLWRSWKDKRSDAIAATVC